MEILVGEYEKDALLHFISEIKSDVASWQIAEIKLSDDAVKSLGTRQAAVLVQEQFTDIPGMLVICSFQELFMLIKVEGKLPRSKVSSLTADALSNYACDVFVDDLSVEGISKMKILIKGPKVSAPSLNEMTLQERRRARIFNLVYIVDDDFFIRSLIEKAFKGRAIIKHFSDGASVFEAYKSDMPDMVLLDYHFPEKNGSIIVQELKEIDPEAYVVMLSADSSKDNVLNTTRLGAKGFLTKPFTVKKLMDYYKKCPTAA